MKTLTSPLIYNQLVRFEINNQLPGAATVMGLLKEAFVQRELAEIRMNVVRNGLSAIRTELKARGFRNGIDSDTAKQLEKEPTDTFLQTGIVVLEEIEIGGKSLEVSIYEEFRAPIDGKVRLGYRCKTESILGSSDVYIYLNDSDKVDVHVILYNINATQA